MSAKFLQQMHNNRPANTVRCSNPGGGDGIGGTFVSEIRQRDSSEAKLKSCLYSPDGLHLVTASFGGLVQVWNAEDTYRCVQKQAVATKLSWKTICVP